MHTKNQIYRVIIDCINFVTKFHCFYSVKINSVSWFVNQHISVFFIYRATKNRQFYRWSNDLLSSSFILLLLLLFLFSSDFALISRWMHTFCFEYVNIQISFLFDDDNNNKMMKMLVQHMCSVFNAQQFPSHLFELVKFHFYYGSDFHLFRILHVVQDYYRNTRYKRQLLGITSYTWNHRSEILRIDKVYMILNGALGV